MIDYPVGTHVLGELGRLHISLACKSWIYYEKEEEQEQKEQEEEEKGSTLATGVGLSMAIGRYGFPLLLALEQAPLLRHLLLQRLSKPPPNPLYIIYMHKSSRQGENREGSTTCGARVRFYFRVKPAQRWLV